MKKAVRVRVRAAAVFLEIKMSKQLDIRIHL